MPRFLCAQARLLHPQEWCVYSPAGRAWRLRPAHLLKPVSHLPLHLLESVLGGIVLEPQPVLGGLQLLPELLHPSLKLWEYGQVMQGMRVIQA